MMDCCICGEQIKPDPNGWDKGHNARPFKNGQCCRKCNDDVVLPHRAALFMYPPQYLGYLMEQDTSPNNKGEA